MAQWRVEVTGLRQVYDALGQIDKAAQKSINKVITDAGKAVAVAASYFAPGSNPISNWGTWNNGGRDLGYNPSVVSSSFKPRRSNFRRRGVSAGLGYDVYQMNPGGAIFELVGSGSGQFVESIADRFSGKRPRSLIPAYYEVMGQEGEKANEIRDMILDAARRAGLV